MEFVFVSGNGNNIFTITYAFKHLMLEVYMIEKEKSHKELNAAKAFEVSPRTSSFNSP